jgi:hypothetical protein
MLQIYEISYYKELVELWSSRTDDDDGELITDISVFKKKN